MTPEERLGDVEADIRRIWDARPEEEEALLADAFVMLDRATSLRREAAEGPDWAVARLAEGLARLLAAREAAGWGNRSYTIQALEAALDGLRDAAAHLPDGHSPTRAEVTAFRARLLVEWRAVQSEPDLGRIAALPLAALRG